MITANAELRDTDGTLYWHGDLAGQELEDETGRKVQWRWPPSNHAEAGHQYDFRWIVDQGEGWKRLSYSARCEPDGYGGWRGV